MGTRPKRASRGDKLRITASFWNDLRSMVRWWKSLGVIGSQVQGSIEATQTVVMMKNGTGADLKRGEIMEIDDALGTYGNQFKNYYPLLGKAGTDGAPTENLAVCRQAIKDGASGKVVIAGIVPALIDVNDETDEFCINTASSKLQSAPGGSFKILAKDSGTGEKWALVRFIPMTKLLLQAPSGGISARSGDTPGTGDCTIRRKNSSGDYELTSLPDITAVENWTLSDGVGANGDRYIEASYHTGAWLVDAEDCTDVQGFDDGFDEGFM